MNNDLANIISALSVLLVFLTFLLNAIQEQVEDEIAKKKSPSTAEKNKLIDRSTRKLLFFKAIPITLAFIAAFLILLPRTFTISRSYDLNVTSPDELVSLFVLIEAGLLGLAIFAFYKVAMLIKKLCNKTG